MIWPLESPGIRQELCLILSHRCNLNCTYCYVDKSRPDPGRMPLDVAQRAITEAFAKCQYDQLELSFLGGEPLAEFDRIAEIVEWVMAREWEKPYFFFATVNGTLLNDEMKEWFRQRRDVFYLCLSYDGSYFAQDVNRSGSKGMIDLEFFRENWPDQPVKMTVSEDAVSHLAENVIELHELGIGIDASIALGTELWKPESVRQFRKELDQLMDYYLLHPEVRPIAFLSHDLRGVFTKHTPGTRYCGAGKQFTALYLDGSRHPCHLLSPLVMSSEQLTRVAELDIWNTPVEDLPVCCDCAIRPFCPMCLGMNFKHSGNPARRDLNSCRLVKAQILAACRFQALLISRKDCPDESDLQMASAVLMLSRLLKNEEL